VPACHCLTKLFWFISFPDPAFDDCSMRIFTPHAVILLCARHSNFKVISCRVRLFYGSYPQYLLFVFAVLYSPCRLALCDTCFKIHESNECVRLMCVSNQKNTNGHVVWPLSQSGTYRFVSAWVLFQLSDKFYRSACKPLMRTGVVYHLFQNSRE
jgi:hypothetical protein